VIHAVGPVWHGGDRGEDEALASCYRRSLEIAAEHGLRTLAFPAISCGIYRFPAERAAEIALSTVARGLRANDRLERVVFALVDERVERAFRERLDRADPVSR
jgi:O-acetyl-ADP-ribose deacetylase (regulator of RNase III)